MISFKFDHEFPKKTNDEGRVINSLCGLDKINHVQQLFLYLMWRFTF